MKSIADIKAIRDKMQAQIVNRDNKDAELETRIVVGNSWIRSLPAGLRT